MTLDRLTLAAIRRRRIEVMCESADVLEIRAAEVLTALTEVETRATAEIELDKTLRALRKYDSELPPLTDRVPLGSVFVSLPYNTPLYSFVLYGAGPAIAGNSVSIRASSATGEALRAAIEPISDLTASAGITLFEGSGREFIQKGLVEGAANAFVFTGSWESVQQLIPLRRDHQRLIYSGSGMNPFIVLEDADLDAALESAVYTRLFNSGQDCLAPEVFFIHDDVKDEFIDRLRVRLEAIRLGPLSDPLTDVGQLVNEDVAQHAKDLLRENYVDRRFRYAVPPPTDFAHANLICPSVIETSIEDPIVLEEKFAPIFVVVPFTDLDVVHAWVRSSPYALCLTQFGGDTPDEWPVPQVSFNACAMKEEEADAHVPFGGTGRSGFVIGPHGTHEGPVLFSVETTTPES